MNCEFYSHDIAHDNNLSHSTLKSYKIHTENFQILWRIKKKKKEEDQDYFSLLTSHLSTSLSPVSSLSSSKRRCVALGGDWGITQREWFSGGKFELGQIANKKIQV